MTRSSILGAAVAVLILTWATCVPAEATAQRVDIETAGRSDLVTVSASAEMHVDPRTVWDVISDYDHLAEFIPNMRSSRVVQRNGDRVLVEQTGVFGFLFVQQLVEVKLAVVETPPRRIVAHAIGGNLREMEGRYELENLPTGAIRLSYFGSAIPEFSVPPIVAKMVVRGILTKQFAAVVEEIVRRDALVKDAPHPR